MQYINGVDHLLSEYDIYQNLTLPIHHAIRKLPKKAKMPPSAISGSDFPKAIGCNSNKDAHNDSLSVFAISGIKPDEDTNFGKGCSWLN